jgi:hypothetical protein
MSLFPWGIFCCSYLSNISAFYPKKNCFHHVTISGFGSLLIVLHLLMPCVALNIIIASKFQLVAFRAAFECKLLLCRMDCFIAAYCADSLIPLLM